MKITKQITKDAFMNNPMDVLILQVALNSLKDKAGKLYYSGKLDALMGPMLLSALMRFQTDNGLPATGKVESHGPTLTQIKGKLMVDVRMQLAHGVATTLSGTAGKMQLLAVTTLATKELIKRKLNLSKNLEAELAKIVTKAANNFAAPLKLKSITKRADQRVEVLFTIPNDVFPSKRAEEIQKPILQALQQLVSDARSWKWAKNGDTVKATSGIRVPLVTKDPVLEEKFNGTRLHPVESFSMSKEGRAFIIEWEKTKRVNSNDNTSNHRLYEDSADHCTIGYGELVHEGLCDGLHPTEQPFLNGITEEQAQAFLTESIMIAEKNVKTRLKGTRVTQFMFDAYVSLLYNLGLTKARKDWKVFENTRLCEYEAAAKEFLDITSGGKNGLRRRRFAEYKLFLDEVYLGNTVALTEFIETRRDPVR